MKKSVCILMACALLFSCARPVEVEEPAWNEEQGYTLTVVADKAGTKTLGLDGSGALKATWTEGETVAVYRSSNLVGTLTAQSTGSASTTLRGTIHGTFAVDNSLTLQFLEPDYATQDGTLHGSATSIDRVCDCATASVTITAISGGNITTGSATFRNRQAIVKFLLKNSDKSSDVPVDNMTITIGGQTISVTPATVTNELYVAIPGFSSKSISVVAMNGENLYYKDTAATTLEEGSYYVITLALNAAAMIHNETELKAAIDAEHPRIILVNDILLGSYLDVSAKTVAIDLNGHKLYRNLDGFVSNGHVIGVRNGASLTLKSSVSGASIEGGKAIYGGAIHILSGNTVTASNITFQNNAVSGDGGAIWNGGTFSVTDCSILANGCEGNGGGIWSNGTLNMAGTVRVENNLKSGSTNNVFLKNDTYITLTGALTRDSNIGLSHESTLGRCTLNYYYYHSGGMVAPSDFFFADNSAVLQVALGSGNEVFLVSK